MDFIAKHKYSFLTIVLLVLLNVFSLSALWFQILNRTPAPPPDRPGNDLRSAQHFLERELLLTEDQIEEFGKLRSQYFSDSRNIVEEIHKLKREIMDELFLPSPDSSKVAGISENIGEKQAQLERLNFYHFLELKAICQPGQEEKFRRLIRDLQDAARPRRNDPPPRSDQFPRRNRR